LTRTRIGLGIVLLIVLSALLGPAIAPHSPTAFVGPPFSPPSSQALFGTDTLGRDVLSRFLNGGRTVIGLSLAAALLGVGFGAVLGLMAAQARGLTDELLMRGNDVLLAFPQIVLVLLLVSGWGPHLWLIVLTVALGHAPRTARVIRGAAGEVVERDFMKIAEMLGEKRRRLLLNELLPNVASPLLVEFGLRLTYSIGIIAAVSFLGFGLQPPTADWGLMVNENRLGITQQPWAVLLPVLAIAFLTVGTNLMTDGIARAAAGIQRRGRK
jgi:peptide/nickel transport system permease protein